MPDGDGDGGALRKQLESALAENKTLKRKLLVGSGPYGLVKEGDLSELKADEPLEVWEAKAKEVQGARQSEQRDLLKQAGLDDTTVEKILAGQKVDATGTPAEGAVQRIVGLGSIGGGRVPSQAETGAIGYGKIKEHFQDQAKTK